MAARYWIAVASKEHVLKGQAGGFCQVCHGKKRPLQQMQPGDWIIYYSPTEQFRGKEPYRAFTAIGKICNGEPYTYEMAPDFIPWRRGVEFVKSVDAPIKPLLSLLSFTQNKNSWGFIFKRGLFEISREDFIHIAAAMHGAQSEYHGY